MAKRSTRDKRTEQERKEDRTLRRVFDVFLLGLAAECYLLLVYRGYATGPVDSVLAWHTFLSWGTAIGAVLVVAGCILLLLPRKRWGKTGRILGDLALWAFGIGVFLAVTGWVMTRSLDPFYVTVMCIMVPIVTVLAMIFLLYQHECFLCTVALSGVLFTVWARGVTAASVSWRVPVIAGAVFGVVLLAAAAALARKAQQGGGKLWGVSVATADCDYRVVYGVLAMGFLCVVAALALPTLTYYLMWAAGILLFAELVYYTTKLM